MNWYISSGDVILIVSNGEDGILNVHIGLQSLKRRYIC